MYKRQVLQNDSILKITTPYMRFYELEALCALGEQESVMKEMKAYWGGMLKEYSRQESIEVRPLVPIGNFIFLCYCMPMLDFLF